MKSFVGVFLAGLCVSILLVGCGGENGSSSSDTDSDGIQITGAGIKGPLAFADVKLYAIDPSFPDFYDKASPISVAITNQYAEIIGLTVPRRIKSPYILVIDGSNGIDLNTGVAPVIDVLITVITDDMLTSNRPIFATPLTTLVFHMARLSSITTERMTRGGARKAFVKNINNAASIASSTFLIGQGHDIDLFRSPLVINENTIDPVEQGLAVFHRAAVEAFAANVYMLAQKEDISSDAFIENMALDIHTDGVIDDSDNGIPISNIYPMAFSQVPMNLVIPSTSYRISEIMQLMDDERILLGTDRGAAFLVDEIAFPEGTTTTDTTTSRSSGMDPTIFVEAVAGSFPIDLSGTAPEKASLILNVYKPADAVNGMLTLSAYDADAPREGDLVINGNSSIRLFKSWGVAENDKRLVDITISTPASYWNDGDNKLTFHHVRSGGYSINGVTVSFDGSSTPDPEPVVPDPGPVATFSVDNIDFGSLYIGEISDPTELVITNTGTAPFNITSITITTDYMETNNCNSQIRIGESCIIDIQYLPATSGLFKGSLTISGNTSEKHHVINLKGFSVGLEDKGLLITDPQSPDVLLYHDFDDESLHTYTKTEIANTWNTSQQFAKNNTIKIVQDPDPIGTHGHVMRAFYAANTVHNRNGSGFYFRTNIGSHNEMYFAYDVFFEDDAEFTKGGKLPGLGIADYFSNSGVMPDGTDRWTGSLAWRAGGEIANYVYHANQQGRYGDIFRWNDGANGQVYFKKGEWNRIEIYYKMNTPGELDGRIKGWLNGDLALDSNRPMYRMPGGEHLTIGATAMITQYGGGDTFAPLTDQHIYFDNFVVSTQPITH